MLRLFGRADQYGRLERERDLILMRSEASDMRRCRFGRFSGAQSGSAVRGVGDLPESAPTTLIKNYLFESALVSVVNFRNTELRALKWW
jgi:hypothetical protein